MNQKEYKRRIAFEVLVILGMLALLTFFCRLWPILLLIILGIFVAAIRLLFLSSKKVEVIVSLPAVQEPAQEPTERDVREMAYAVILRRITELVLSEYPEARWVWENANAQKSIENGEAVFILLNRAGGYRRAKVEIKNLQVLGVTYCTVETPPIENDDEPDTPEVPTEDSESEEDTECPENYELMAFEWTEAHIVELNARCNEAIAKKQYSIVLTADELPAKESWANICDELIRAGLENVTCLEKGIQIILTH